MIDHLWALSQDYTIGEKFRWGNSLVVLFITQRSLLLGMPLTIAVLAWIWRTFTAEPDSAETRPVYPWWLAPFVIGLLAGTLPLIHLHSLFVLFVVTGSCFVLRPDRWREWLAFGIGVSVIALPELAWSMTGSASKVSEFIGYKFGWDMPADKAMPYWQMPFWLMVFWLKNAGLTLPMIVAGSYLLLRARKNALFQNAAGDPKENKPAVKARDSRKVVGPQVVPSALLYFYVPFIFLFAVSNAMKLAPWEWDNIKVLIYWFVGSLPIIAYALVRLWQANALLKVAAGVVFVTLIAAGGLDVFRTVSSQNRIKVFDTDATRLAEQIKVKTPPNALFLNAPTYNSAVVLSGRRSFMRYSGHLSSHGIDYLPRERDVKTIYEGGGVADILLRENAIDYVLVSPAETGDLGANEAYFRKFPLIAESGPYRVYHVR